MIRGGDAACKAPLEHIRLAGLAIQFLIKHDFTAPRNVADWSPERPAPSSPSQTWRVFPGSEPGSGVLIDDRQRQVTIRRLNGRRSMSYPEALLELLLHHRVLPVHAAAFLKPGRDEGATMLCAPSGGGKSSLSWLAVSAGRRLLSDDHIGLRRAEDGGLELIPLKRSVAVDKRLLRERPAAFTEESMVRGGEKLRFDPETMVSSCRALKARPRALVFLERGDARRIAPLSPADAFVRLVSQSAALKPSARPLRPLLKELADLVPAVTATLTRSCLEDQSVLDELGA